MHHVFTSMEYTLPSIPISTFEASACTVTTTAHGNLHNQSMERASRQWERQAPLGSAERLATSPLEGHALHYGGIQTWGPAVTLASSHPEEIRRTGLQSRASAMRLASSPPAEIGGTNFQTLGSAARVASLHPEEIGWSQVQTGASAVILASSHPEEIRCTRLQSRASAMRLASSPPAEIGWTDIQTTNYSPPLPPTRIAYRVLPDHFYVRFLDF